MQKKDLVLILFLRWPGIVEDDPDFGSFFDCEKKGEKKLVSC